MNRQHILGGIEIFVLSALPSWLQSSTGKTFLSSHLGIADALFAGYVGLRAVGLTLKVQQQNPLPPAGPAETSKSK